MKLIIFDLDNTLLDTTGQSHLILNGKIESIVPFNDTLSLLEKLAEAKIHRALVTYDTLKERQFKKIEVLGFISYFEDIYVCERAEEKHDAFKKILKKYPHIKTKDICVVGDRIDLEIMYGNMLGCETVQLCFGKYSNLKPENEFQISKHKIQSIEEIYDLMSITPKN